MIGVALACYGEIEVGLPGFVATCFCVLLAALKVVLSGEMLTGSNKVSQSSFVAWPRGVSVTVSSSREVPVIMRRLEAYVLPCRGRVPACLSYLGMRVAGLLGAVSGKRW